MKPFIILNRIDAYQIQSKTKKNNELYFVNFNLSSENTGSSAYSQRFPNINASSGSVYPNNSKKKMGMLSTNKINVSNPSPPIFNNLSFIR